MPIDFTPSHEYFIEESLESLAETQCSLRQFNTANPDLNLISQVFRVIHSIKGTAATLEMVDITALTHHFENILDYIRSITTSSHALNDLHVRVLLLSLDEISTYLDIYRMGETPSREQHQQTILNLDALFVELKEVHGAQIELSPAVSVHSAIQAPEHRYQIELFHVTQKDIRQVTDSLTVLGTLKEITDNQGAVACFELITTETRETLELVCAFYVSRKDIVITLLDDARAHPAPLSSKAGSNQKTPSETNPSINQSVRVTIGELVELKNLITHLIEIKNKIVILEDEFSHARNVKSLDQYLQELHQLSTQMSRSSLDHLFSKLPVLTQNLAARLEKKVELLTIGASVVTDKFIAQQLNVPLIQLIRNCIDHGIETPEVRRHLNKAECGTINLYARQEYNRLILEISDDGAGLDRNKVLKAAKNKNIAVTHITEDHEVWNLIFAPGLTTARSVTDISGRGVGLDIVKQRIENLAGQIKVESVLGQGTKFIISIPIAPLTENDYIKGCRENQS